MQIDFDPLRKSVFRRENGQYRLYATIFRDVSKTKSSDLKRNLLGTNVIEKFRVFQDNEDDCFYFQVNNNPRYYTTENGDSFAGGIPFSPDNKSSLFINNVI